MANPRVVIAAPVTGENDVDVTETNLNGRLFLAANMERGAKGGDPRVTLVEFISWNTLRRRFDFGVIENMGGDDEPKLKIVDGGRCFACHKNRGPILGGPPWSNTTHDDIIRLATAAGHRMEGTDLPESGPFTLPKPAANRKRIDGMALSTPEAAVVDLAVRQGAILRLNRDTFRLMTRSADGRRALIGLLVAVVGQEALDPNDKEAKVALDNTFEKSYVRFAADWAVLRRAAKPDMLADVDPSALLISSGVRPFTRTRPVTPVVRVQGLVRGNGSLWSAPPRTRPGVTSQPRSRSASASASATPPPIVSADVMLAVAAARKAAADNVAALTLAATLDELARYEAARSVGYHGLFSQAQPSNPVAFIKPSTRAPSRPSGMLSAPMLAATIGLTESDRKFLADSLADAAKRTGLPKVTPAALARAVFEGQEFEGLFAGGALPDRDEFKDCFVAGLHAVLMEDYPATKGFTPERRTYASGPKYDPELAKEAELAVAPTTACLRCHDVRATGKRPAFEPIPALAFDPLDKTSREGWVRQTNWERRVPVLERMLTRLSTDADMPPHDSPEHEHFRVKQAVAFVDAKSFLERELSKVKK
jgi:hypothetical protein